MKENRNNSNLAMRAAAVLFCLTMLSLWVLTGTYAKYITQASGSDSARTAAFDISDTNSLQQTFAVSLYPGKKENISINVTNKSEVAVRYIFTYETDGNIPLTINMDAETGKTVPVKSADGSNTFSVDCVPAKGEETDHYSAVLSMSNDNYQYSGGVQWITLTLKAEQID